MNGNPEIWPTEIRLTADRSSLKMQFDNGAQCTLSAHLLRIESPSAEVQGHHPSEKKILTGKENVRITAVSPVGNYAVRLTFDDGHDSGLYTWDYLYGLGQRR